MKKQFIIILLFYWIFHFVVPWIDFIFFGFVNLYSDVEGYDGMIINTLSIWAVIAVIWFRPSTDETVLPKFNHATSFFVISILISLYKFVSGGGYSGLITGASQGSFISFVSLFFNVNTAFLLMLCLQRNIKHVYILLLSYIIFTTATGSRSGIVSIILIMFILPLFVNYKSIKSKLYKFVLLVSIISPFLFAYATLTRGDIDKSILGEMIVGRISMIELSMIPLAGKEDGSMDERVYYDKYSFSNQFKQSINAISPIDPFTYDVSPNQYFRVVFLGHSEVNVIDSYWSMNMTLPIYFVLMTNIFFGVILTIVFLVLLYLFWFKFRSNIYVLILIIIALYDILYFFDWVMVVQTMFSSFLTIFALTKYNLILNLFTIKKSNKQIDLK